MTNSKNNLGNYFIINGIKYSLREDVQSLEEAINSELNPIYHDVITVHIDKIGKNYIDIRYKRKLKYAPAQGCIFIQDASLITGLDIDSFDPTCNKDIVMRAFALPGDPTFQLFILELEAFFKWQLKKMTKSAVRSVKIENSTENLIVRIKYKS